MSEGDNGGLPQVDNPYLAAIRVRRSESVPITADLRAALDRVVSAMENDAWRSTTADIFESELTGHRTTLGSGADGVLTEFDDAIAQQPEQVEWDSWQVRWRNL